MSKAWELLLLLLLTTAAIKLVIEFVTPLIPYLALGVLALISIRYFYNKKTRW